MVKVALGDIVGEEEGNHLFALREELKERERERREEQAAGISRSANPDTPLQNLHNVRLMSAKRYRPPRENWGRLIYRPYLRLVGSSRPVPGCGPPTSAETARGADRGARHGPGRAEGSARRKQPTMVTAIAILATAISLGIVLALLVHMFG